VVHTGVKFSCRFTFAEVQGRFWALMYDPAVNRVAMAAMRNLHPEMIAAVKHKALFSSAEEILLARIPAVSLKFSPINAQFNFCLFQNSQPDLEVFQKLLEENANVFYESRAPKTLFNHWLLMRQYHLLPDQTSIKIPSHFFLICLNGFCFRSRVSTTGSNCQFVRHRRFDARR